MDKATKLVLIPLAVASMAWLVGYLFPACWGIKCIETFKVSDDRYRFVGDFCYSPTKMYFTARQERFEYAFWYFHVFQYMVAPSYNLYITDFERRSIYIVPAKYWYTDRSISEVEECRADRTLRLKR